MEERIFGRVRELVRLAGALLKHLLDGCRTTVGFPLPMTRYSSRYSGPKCDLSEKSVNPNGLARKRQLRLSASGAPISRGIATIQCPRGIGETST